MMLKAQTMRRIRRSIDIAKKEVDSSTEMTLKLAPGGGQAMIIRPAK